MNLIHPGMCMCVYGGWMHDSVCVLWGERGECMLVWVFGFSRTRVKSLTFTEASNVFCSFTAACFFISKYLLNKCSNVSHLYTHKTVLTPSICPYRLSKKCRPKSEATESGIWSGSILFATSSSSSLDTSTDNKMDLFKLRPSMVRTLTCLTTLGKYEISRVERKTSVSQMVVFPQT